MVETPRSYGGGRGRFTKAVMVARAVSLMVICLTQLTKQSEAGECLPGYYRASGQRCCLLCPAGTFKYEDCRVDMGYSTCLSCSKGHYYTDADNSLSRCKACGSCTDNEEMIARCTAKTDTVCECKDGYEKVKHSSVCVLTGNASADEGFYAGHYVAVIVSVAFVVLLFCVVICWRRRRLRKARRSLPVGRTVDDNAWKPSERWLPEDDDVHELTKPVFVRTYSDTSRGEDEALKRRSVDFSKYNKPINPRRSLPVGRTVDDNAWKPSERWLPEDDDVHELTKPVFVRTYSDTSRGETEALKRRRVDFSDYNKPIKSRTSLPPAWWPVVDNVSKQSERWLPKDDDVHELSKPVFFLPKDDDVHELTNPVFVRTYSDTSRGEDEGSSQT